MSKISLGSWTFTVGGYAEKPESLEAVIRGAAEIGYQGIALGGFPPHGSVERYPDRRLRRELLDSVRDAGLEINSYAPDMLDCHFYAGTPRQIARYSERFDRSLEFCVDCEISTIRVDTVTMTPYPDDFDYRRAWDTTVELFRSDAEKAAAAGVTVAWEFEPGRLFNKPSEILGIIESVNNDNFAIQYDTAHGQLCAVVGAHQFGEHETLPGGQVELIHRLSNRIADVHLIDTDNTMYRNSNSHKVAFGAGVVNFTEIVECIQSNGYDGEWWTVDLGPQHGDVWGIAAGAYKDVVRMLA